MRADGDDEDARMNASSIARLLVPDARNSR
jgi:hypothetical protein